MLFSGGVSPRSLKLVKKAADYIGDANDSLAQAFLTEELDPSSSPEFLAWSKVFTEIAKELAVCSVMRKLPELPPVVFRDERQNQTDQKDSA